MADLNKIRNFSVISHVDHGKSTLADRFLEVTKSVEDRDMQSQFLDQMELERERGITVKMAPVRMKYKDHILNLIDTPGHSDFSYEVSRALAAVEGAVLLVDGSQGVQAQTVANFRVAEELNLDVIGAVNKIDLFQEGEGKVLGKERLEKTVSELRSLIGEDREIFRISAKTGEGVEELLDGIVGSFPSPKLEEGNSSRALIFDSFYDVHKGVVAGVRVYEGGFGQEDDLYLMAAKREFSPKEVGFFTPELEPKDRLGPGEMGYIATGLKEPKDIRIGDTITHYEKREEMNPLPGYKEPSPHVFVSFYPEGDDYEELGKALEKLRLNDSALTIEGDRSEILGRGYKVGFLGKLHYEITDQRLREEFGLRSVNTFPSVVYEIKKENGEIEKISRPEKLPENFEEIREPIVDIDIFVPPEYLNDLLAIQNKFRLSDIEVETVGDILRVAGEMPLPELISGFSGELKSVTEGFGSFSYEFKEFAEADVVKVDILVSKELVPGLSRFLHRSKHRQEAREMVEELVEHLPRKQYSQPVQARAEGDIIVREDVPAIRKDVTEGLYGGDYSRKKKQLEKQREGKKKLREMDQGEIDPEVFKKILKK